jgi:hypothetical protein
VLKAAVLKSFKSIKLRSASKWMQGINILKRHSVILQSRIGFRVKDYLNINEETSFSF